MPLSKSVKMVVGDAPGIIFFNCCSKRTSVFFVLSGAALSAYQCVLLASSEMVFCVLKINQTPVVNISPESYSINGSPFFVNVFLQ